MATLRVQGADVERRSYVTRIVSVAKAHLLNNHQFAQIRNRKTRVVEPRAPVTMLIALKPSNLTPLFIVRLRRSTRRCWQPVESD